MTPEDFIIITQARMTSTRLPGKIMREINGRTLLSYHIERLRQTGIKIVVATTLNDEDDMVASYCADENIDCVRGDEHDVLSRFAEVFKQHRAKYFIRVTSDCPLIDPSLILDGVNKYIELNNENIYLSNCFPRSYARGFDYEIASINSLMDADQTTTDSFDREHVTPYLWKNKTGRVKIQNISQDEDHSTLRICVDTPEDFELIKILISDYHAETMNHTEIESLMVSHPELVAINAMVEQKKNT